MKKCLLNKGDEETSERLRTKIFQLILERTNQRRLLEELKKKKKVWLLNFLIQMVRWDINKQRELK